MHDQSIFLNSLDHIDSSWNDFLNDGILQILADIEKGITGSNKEFTPTEDKVLRFLRYPIHKIQIIILGQDPYPQKGVATGKAFEVGTLQSWQDKFSNISLKNIVRAIYHAYQNKYLKYSEIKKELGLYFQLSPPNRLFNEWEKQGVLLLNTSFTCELGKPNSHQKNWSEFTKRLLKYISKKNSDIIWFLWGNNAKAIVSDIRIENKIESMHPMMCYQKPERTNDFLFGDVNCFKQTKHLINWLG